MGIHRRDRGTGLILAMVFVAILASFAAVMLTDSGTRMRAVVDSIDATQNRLLAEAALEAALADLETPGATGVLGTAQDPELFNVNVGTADERALGGYWTEVVDLGNPADPLNTLLLYKKITGYGRLDTGEAVARYGMIVEGTREATHEAFSGKYGVWVGGGDKLIFKGQVGGGPGNADRVYGDVYVDGELACQAASRVIGDSYATGKITGKPPTGTKHPYSPRIDPPDFTKLKDKCDINVGKAFEGTTWTRPKSQTGWTERGNIVDTGVLTVPKDDPAHIFAKDSFTPGAMGGVATNADNYQLGDWVSSNDGQTVRVYEDGNHKSYYVPGNLWIDPQGYGPTFHLDGNPADDGVQITIIVEGNVYVGDEMYYEGQSYKADGDPKLNGVAIIAIKARDEFGVPVNENSDPADDRPEGYGNVYFGDLNRNVRPLEVNAILMAEDEFLDKVLKDGAPLEFTLNGLMACGGNLELIDRGHYANYAPMTVRHDERLENGSIALPNLPTSGKGDPAKPPTWDKDPIVRWRVRQWTP